MTITQLIERIDEIYPNGESNNTKIHFMNIGLDTLYPEFGITKTDESVFTIQGADEYNYPSPITDIAQIYDVAIGNRPVPQNRNDYIKYALGYEDEIQMVGRIFFQTYDSSGNKKLGFNPIPSRTGLPIRIKYRQRFAPLDPADMAQEPELRPEYQMILVFYAAFSIAAAGASPDAVQADSFMQRYDTMLLDMWRDKMNREAEHPKVRKDNLTWRRFR